MRWRKDECDRLQGKRGELINRDRELAREIWRKAKDCTGNRTEREELKKLGQGSRQRERQK